MIKEFEAVPCPACGEFGATPVRTKHDIVECIGCGLVYLRTRGTKESLEEHYQRYASNPGSHMRVPSTISEAKKSGLRRDYFLSDVMNCVGKPEPDYRTRILDIGSGWSAFLDNAKEKGYGVQGIEICREMAHYSVNVLRIPCYRQQLESIDFPPRYFSAVTAIHSLEHLPNVATALRTIHRILEDNGCFCGIVPNFNSYVSQKQKDNWCWLDPEMHYAHFTPTTLDSTLRRFDFQPISIYTKQGDFDGNIIQQQIRIHEPHVHAIAERMVELEQTGQGEEIRFFAMKNP